MKPPSKRSFDPQDFLSRINGGRSIATYKAGKVAYSQGDPADSVFYIKKGKAKVTVVSEQGKEAVVALLREGDFFGEGALAGQLLRIATVFAVTDCVLVRIPKAEIKRVIRQQPAFAEMFLTYVLARNTRVEADLVDQLFNSSEKRLARTLLLLSNFGKDEKPELVPARISQETLAEIVGTTRSRVSFFLNKFRKLGLIDYNGQIKVHPSLLNVVLHEKPKLRTARRK